LRNFDLSLSESVEGIFLAYSETMVSVPAFRHMSQRRVDIAVLAMAQFISFVYSVTSSGTSGFPASARSPSGQPPPQSSLLKICHPNYQVSMLRLFLPSRAGGGGTESKTLLIQWRESAGSMTSSTANETPELRALPRT
jgi:hypothetical protein